MGEKMEIPDFISATILTIIGIILAEIFIHYIKEKSFRDKIIASLFVEVSENFKISKGNIEIIDLNLRKGFNASFIPYKTVAHEKYNRYIDSKLLKIISIDGERHLSQAYSLMEDLNRWMMVKGYHPAGDFDLIFDSVKEELEEFIKVIKNKKHFKKFSKSYPINF